MDSTASDGPGGNAPSGEPTQLTPAHPVTPRPAPLPDREPAQGLSLIVSAVWQQARGNPLPVAALIFGFLLALRVFRRPD
jgi:hypothetical protein